ncbi:beta-N-acetylhexosaminidase [Paenibacillus sp. N1-5-1-14]|uniref:beta-N-acetylhexosaminidase n=1 Tax=Paenibacillus radicibacter TaxID=2972488 RepID=UPI0021590729|nr:beta-N-acetylhexosaminidase [Paenibacillus radicibacter]MCR8641126.1 beta-N-acetylhexosaminidase [Paenibacillus radicibacter]
MNLRLQKFSVALCSLLLVSLTACTPMNNQSKPVQSSPDTVVISTSTPQTVPTETPTLSNDEAIKHQVASLSAEEKIGQLVLVGADYLTADDHTQTLIQKYKVSGFVLFARNIQSQEQTLTLVNDLKQANAVNKLPLIMSIDEEGGKVTRLPDSYKGLPNNSVIGRVNNETFAYEFGKRLADKVKSVGLNMNYAPVLDINSNPQNPIIGVRAYGDKPNLVSKLGLQTMKGIQSKGVISVVKHFPGHGDTHVDSHLGLPVVDYDLKRLKSFELVPFVNAINNGADAVMVAHILMSQIDAKLPASLSRAVITDVLRKELNFQGVVVTDDLTMAAITSQRDIGDAAVLALQAGSDLVMVCHGYDNQTRVLHAIKNAVDKGTISNEQLDQSVARVIKMKQKYHMQDSPGKPVSIETMNQSIDDLLNKYMK